MRSFVLLISLAVLLLLNAGAPVLAQVPPHQPGTICFTPDFWCWAVQPGQPGTGCMCGSVAGIFG